MLFLDETQSTAQKHQNRLSKASGKPSKHESRTETLNEVASKPPDRPFDGEQKQSSPRLTTICPQMLVDDIATNYLLSTYIRDSHFNYLARLYTSSLASGLFPETVHAVGLACLARESKDTELMAKARQGYSQALISTNAALRSPSEVYNDETLGSVLLLGYFETVVYEGCPSIVAWSNHIQGALSVLHLRGPDQFKTSPMSLEFYLQISTGIRAVCVQQSTRIPPQLRDLKHQVSAYLEYGSDLGPYLEYAEICDDYLELKASVHEGSLTDFDAIASWASKVDGELVNLMTTLPASFNYEVRLLIEDVAEVFDHRYHVYQNYRAPQFWNTLRMTRLAVNEMIHELATYEQWKMIKGEGDKLKLLIDKSHENVIDMGYQVCESIPQYLWHTSGSPSGNGVAIASAYWMMWPLYVTSESFLTPQAMRDWMLDRIRHIGLDMKIPHAVTIAEQLSSTSASGRKG